MTIEQSGIVDLIAVSPDDQVACLIVSDHLEWGGQKDKAHMLRLQEKINEYLSFVEGGTLFEARPDLNGLRLVIKVVSLYQPSHDGNIFLEKLRDFLASAGYPFVFELRTDSVV